MRTGGTVVVRGGTYATQVTVAKQASIQGRDGATVNAPGQINGLLVTASHATGSGLTVENATGEGVLVTGADHVTLAGNTVVHNDLGGSPTNPVSTTTYAECARRRACAATAARAST